MTQEIRAAGLKKQIEHRIGLARAIKIDTTGTNNAEVTASAGLFVCYSAPHGIENGFVAFSISIFFLSMLRLNLNSQILLIRTCHYHTQFKFKI